MDFRRSQKYFFELMVPKQEKTDKEIKKYSLNRQLWPNKFCCGCNIVAIFQWESMFILVLFDKEDEKCVIENSLRFCSVEYNPIQ